MKQSAFNLSIGKKSYEINISNQDQIKFILTLNEFRNKFENYTVYGSYLLFKTVSFVSQLQVLNLK